MSDRPAVLVAGVGGGALGIEIGKALQAAGRYRVVGCDLSPLAFGHYCGVFEATEIVRMDRYVDDVIEVCKKLDVSVVIPGADQPTSLIADARDAFESAGIHVAGNSPGVVATMSDKALCFEELAARGFAIPRTIELIDDPASYAAAPLPCVVKPPTGSGGSAFVFFARTESEVALYATYLRNNGRRAIAQEYVALEGGEFTVGVLSDAAGDVRGAISLRRAFPAKLSIAARGADFLISTGLTQGHIDAYADVTEVAIEIARAFDSRGPINVQGRVDARGRFLPFEINPRFSASTYLRAMAGFNEVDYSVALLLGLSPPALERRAGWYLRGVTEAFVSDDVVRQ